DAGGGNLAACPIRRAASGAHASAAVPSRPPDSGAGPGDAARAAPAGSAARRAASARPPVAGPPDRARRRRGDRRPRAGDPPAPTRGARPRRLSGRGDARPRRAGAHRSTRLAVWVREARCLPHRHPPAARRGLRRRRVPEQEGLRLGAPARRSPGGDRPPAGGRMTRRQPIRILVADDSLTMRNALMALLAQEQDLRIIGEARDGVEAVEKARELRPDVITMDVNMPRLDGLGATAAIMAESPARVLMVCAVSEDRQLDLSFRAMAAGALEVISKPGPAQDELHRFGRRVAEAARLMAEVPVVRRSQGGHGNLRAGGAGVAAIGLVASTGGPPALSVVLRGLPGDLSAPVLIAQHIAAGFTAGLIRWLSEVAVLKVDVAREGDAAQAG